MYMLEIWKGMLDKGEYVYVTFIDMLKSFDTIHHDLVIVK